MAFAKKNLVIERISLYWFTRDNVLSIDKQFVGLGFTKVGGKAFFLEFLQASSFVLFSSRTAISGCHRRHGSPCPPDVSGPDPSLVPYLHKAKNVQ